MAGATRMSLARWLAAGTLIACAMALWLTTGSAGIAATSPQTQTLAATVQKTISWGTAGACTQNMPAVDFGTIVPGVRKDSSIFTGCVSSNAAFNVSVVGTTAMTSGANTLPFSGLWIFNQFDSWTALNCKSFDCPLDASRSVITNEPAATGRKFQFNYGLTAPAGTPEGTYSGGLVTFTASN